MLKLEVLLGNIYQQILYLFILIVIVYFSASQDQTAIIWQWNIATNSVECIHICRGHEQSLETVGVSLNSSEMATGSWDTMLKIWSTCKLIKIYYLK